MVGDLDTGYLAGLPADQRAGLERVDGPGLAALRSYLESGEAMAFLGAGTPAPLYPPDHLAQGRDAADAALRIATRHHLAWHELDALRAHAALDRTENADHDWAAQGDARHVRLVPPGLDPDPLATVERFVAAQKAAEEQAAGDGQDGSAG